MTTQTRDMCVLIPTTITDAMLTSTTVLEVAPSAYAGGTTYAADTRVSVSGSLGLITVYKSLQSSNTGHDPASSPTWWAENCSLYQAYSGAATYAEDERVQDNTTHLIYQSIAGSNTGNAVTDTTKWVEVSANNVWAAYDDEIGTATVGASPLIQVLQPGSVGGIFIGDIVATTGSLVVKDTTGGTVVYTRDIDFDASRIEDVFDWFFVAPEFQTSLAVTDLPEQFTECEITLTLNTTSGMAAAGIIKVCTVLDVGRTMQGAKVGITSRNKLNENEFGNMQVVRVANSKKGSFTVLTEASRFNLLYRALKALDGVLCVFVGTSANGYEEMAMYGLFSDFYIAVDHTRNHICALEIKGGI